MGDPALIVKTIPYSAFRIRVERGLCALQCSVIMPAYNSTAFLPQALDSLLNQTTDDFEVVIVNDGSTDNTQEIIDAYCGRDPRIRCFTQENAGVSAARNKGLSLAKGDYVTFLDADDYYAPDTLAAFMNRAAQTGADLLLGRLCMVAQGKPPYFHDAADALAKEETVETFDKRLLWNFLVSNKCYRRSFLLAHGVQFPATGFSEEGAFFMDAVYAGATIAGAADSVVYYRRHTEEEGLSVSQTASEANLHSLDGSMREIYAAAERAMQEAALTDDAYLQEILYKHLHILISQFYRALWRMTDDALALCTGQMAALLERLTNANREKMEKANADLRLSAFAKTKADAAAHPAVTIAVTRSCTPQAARALFAQTCPLFRLLLTDAAADGLPQELLAQPNVEVRTAVCAADGEPVLRFAALPVLDPSALQTLLRLPVPKTALAAKGLHLLLKRRHGG